MFNCHSQPVQIFSRGHASHFKRVKSSGYTIVELLVASFISLMMVAAAVTYMVSSSISFRAQTNDAFSSENARFALEFLSQNVRRAGLNPTNDNLLEVQGIVDGGYCSAAANASNATGDVTACSRDELSPGSDRLAVDYILTGSVLGCNGTMIDLGPGVWNVSNVFWVGDLDNDGVNSLYCQPIVVRSADTNAAGDGGAGTGRAIGAGVPIIDGVDRMQVQYGVDSVGRDGVIDSYHSMTNLLGLPAPSDMPITRRVKAVRIALLINSGVTPGDDANSERPVDTQFQLLDGPLVNFAADRVYRQVYSTTVMLPSNLPNSP